MKEPWRTRSLVRFFKKKYSKLGVCGLLYYCFKAGGWKTKKAGFAHSFAENFPVFQMHMNMYNAKRSVSFFSKAKLCRVEDDVFLCCCILRYCMNISSLLFLRRVIIFSLSHQMWRKYKYDAFLWCFFLLFSFSWLFLCWAGSTNAVFRLLVIWICCLDIYYLLCFFAQLPLLPVRHSGLVENHEIDLPSRAPFGWREKHLECKWWN